MAPASVLAALLELHGDSSSEFAWNACSALPSRAFVTAAFSQGEGLDWCVAIKVGVTMVGDSSSGTFARDELLAERLAGCAVPGSAAPTACFNSFLVSISVVKLQMDAGIFECAVKTTGVQ